MFLCIHLCLFVSFYKDFFILQSTLYAYYSGNSLVIQNYVPANIFKYMSVNACGTLENMKDNIPALWR